MTIMTAQAYVGPYPYTLLYSYPTVCGSAVIRYGKLIVENTSDMDIEVFSERKGKFNSRDDFDCSGGTLISYGDCDCFSLGTQGLWARQVNEKRGVFARISLTFMNQTSTCCPVEPLPAS